MKPRSSRMRLRAISRTPEICRNVATICRNPTTAWQSALRMQKPLRQRQSLKKRRSPLHHSIVAVLRMFRGTARRTFNSCRLLPHTDGQLILLYVCTVTLVNDVYPAQSIFNSHAITSLINDRSQASLFCCLFYVRWPAFQCVCLAKDRYKAIST